MFLRLWNYFNGYVIISVVGFSVERFINLAAIRGIYIWNIKKEKNRTTMNVSLRGFKKLKECGKKTKCRFKIIDKKGVPFVINKGKRRQVYTGGIFLFVCIIYILSTFTWTVSVEGNSRIPTEDILSFCTEQGLYAGSLKFKTDKREITKKLISNFPEISWVAINTKGTAVTITVVEIIEKTEFVDRLTPTSIIADKDCIIHSISVSQGEPKVRVADVVVKGDLLVDGELSLMEGDLEIGKKYVKAIGEVKGRVTYEMEEKIPLSYIEKIYTGNIKKDKSLLIMDNIVNFIRPNLDGLWEEKNKEIKEFKMGDYIFPIKVEFVEFWGYIEQEKEKTEEEAQQEGETAMERHFQDIVFNGGEIIEKSIEKTVEGNYLILKAKVIVVEDIGKEIEFTRGETDTNE